MNLAIDLVQRFFAAASKFGIEFVENYYNNMLNKLTIQTVQTIQTIQTVQANSAQIFLKTYDINQTARIDKVSDGFLKDGGVVLAILKTQASNLSIKLPHFPKDCKLAKLKTLYKKGTKTDPKIFRQISLLPVASKVNEKATQD